MWKVKTGSLHLWNLCSFLVCNTCFSKRLKEKYSQWRKMKSPHLLRASRFSNGLFFALRPGYRLTKQKLHYFVFSLCIPTFKRKYTLLYFFLVICRFNDLSSSLIFYSLHYSGGLGYVWFCKQGEVTMPIKTKVLLSYHNQREMVKISDQNIFFKILWKNSLS